MTILEMILDERTLTPEQREAKRQRAKARRERAKEDNGSPEEKPHEANGSNEEKPHEANGSHEEKPQEVSDVLRISNDQWANAQWEKLNKIYFNGSLKKPREGVQWTRGMKSRGKCRCDYDYQKNEVYCDVIFLNVKSFSSYTSFRNTLVHEMVHQWFHQQLGEDDIREANGYGKARSRQWWNKLTADAGKDGHHGRWLMKAEELNEAHPELYLGKYSSEDQFNVSDEEKISRTQVASTAHALVRVIRHLGRSKRYFYYVTDEAYQKLKESLAYVTSDESWYEYDFDPERMALKIKYPLSSIGNKCYKIDYFKYLCEIGLIKKSTERRVSPS